MKRETTIKIPGPIFAGEQRFAYVTIERKRATATVRLDVGGIDLSAAASDALQARLEAAGLHSAICRWLANHHEPGKPLLRWQGGLRWGWVRGVPIGKADEFAKLLCWHYRSAVVDLPLHYQQVGGRRLKPGKHIAGSLN